LGNKLYVGNIPFTATEEELRELFGQHGAVSRVDVIMDRETGRPRGFAFVEFEDDQGARAAREALNNTDLGGRSLRVDEAQERGRGGGGGGGGGRGRPGGGGGGRRY
jgi:cold-inducible RNA-binding protein